MFLSDFIKIFFTEKLKLNNIIRTANRRLIFVQKVSTVPKIKLYQVDYRFLTFFFFTYSVGKVKSEIQELIQLTVPLFKDF